MGQQATEIMAPIAFAMIGAFVMLLATGCGDTDAEKKMRNPKDSIVRIEISDHRFDIPLHYMYGEALEKWGNWPTAKQERVKVDALHLSVLLPDLRPYYPEDDARWKVRGHGDRVEVSIMKPVGGSGWFEPLLKRMGDGVLEGRYRKEGERYGLNLFTEKMGDFYFPIDGRALVISCINPNSLPSPSCKVKSDYREGIVIEYYYGLNHLPQWKEIDDKLKALFDLFAKSTEITTNK